MGVFEMDNAKKCCLGSGVAHQTPIPHHTMGQKKCFWIPVIGVFKMDNVPLYTMGQKRCFWIPRTGVFEMDNAKKYCLGSGVAPQTPIPHHTMGQKRCFWIPGIGVFKMDNVWFQGWFWGGTPNTHTSLHHGPEKVFLDT